MISSKLILALSITLLLVIVLNVAIYFSVIRRKTTSSLQMLAKMARRARNPWEDDNARLDELSRQVAELRKAEQIGQDEGEVKRSKIGD